MVELLIVLAIMGVIAAIAVPQALNFAKAYRLHAVASSIASQLNVTRFRATSQYSPYRMNFNTSGSSFTMDRLNSSYSSPVTEFGAQTLPTGISFLTTCPVSAKPGTISSTFSGISSSIFFNTRGLPVDSTGTPSNNNVIYIKNQDDLYDAVTVTLGGQIQSWNYSPGTSSWLAR